MTATNHALTGALIGLTVHNPWVALPAALLSHLVLDALPHYAPINNKGWLAKKSFAWYLGLDALGCVLLVAILFVLQIPYWPLAAVCAFFATSPDMLWVREFLLRRANKKVIYNPIERFLGFVQWFQRPIGAYVEVAWFVGSVVLLWQFL